MTEQAVFLDFATVSCRDDVDATPLYRVLPELVCHDTSTDDEVGTRLATAEVVLLNKIRLDQRRIATAPQLKLICAAATGTDNIDLEAAATRDIAVCNIAAYCTQSVVQHVFALLLALNQHLAGYQALLRDGAWRGSPQFCLLDYPIRELAGKVIGIVGHGELGSAVADVARAFGMHVLLSERPGSPVRAGRVAFEDLLGRVDVLSLHCPLTPQTRGLIGEAELMRMKPGALLINTARGGLVDAPALLQSLQSGQLGGAGIDVLEQEPPVDGNVLLDAGLPNLIVTPHIAWAAIEARQRAIDEMAANVSAWQDGLRRNRVV
ncbi:MAG: D-2-hydroxyacid dehydrogenase [Gammaproteobacteria bacterium]|nr:D-2-hydroxyacid dehydrogenase [Gammaproteobacteria bacterium]